MNTLLKEKKLTPILFLKKSIHFFSVLVLPKSSDEDSRRREFILNVLLCGSVAISFIAFTVVVVKYINFGGAYHGDSPVPAFTALVFFLVLYALSRRGAFITASYLLVGIYFILATYTVYAWGVSIPQGLLTYVLIIVMSGVLVGTRFALITTLLVSITMFIIGFLQNTLIIKPNLMWRDEIGRMSDVLVFIVTFCIITLVSWLSNREIEKSLKRARAAEHDLREERDSLEVKVKERTRELERAQFEKTEQMQRFVEFGRTASGLFHDMVNPVQASLLSLEYIKKLSDATQNVDLKNSVDEAVAQMEKAKNFINIARNQITRQEVNIKFDPEEQVALVFQMLMFRARREKVELIYIPHSAPLQLVGNPLSFNRLIAGLVSNAIDAYDGVLVDNRVRTVTVDCEKEWNTLIVSVTDNGRGIKTEDQKKIFGLFFTTKGIEKGTGIGLALCKEIAEKEFNGRIIFTSKEGVGSMFSVRIPN